MSDDNSGKNVRLAMHILNKVIKENKSEIKITEENQETLQEALSLLRQVSNKFKIKEVEEFLMKAEEK